jgi:hypothetical protein
MANSFWRKRTALILPAVLLTVSLLQDIANYKIREHVRDIHLRTAILVVLYGVGFTIAADWISPWIQRLFTVYRQDSRRQAGKAGIILFYVIGYGALYYAYLVEEMRGPGALLPPSWR